MSALYYVNVVIENTFIDVLSAGRLLRINLYSYIYLFSVLYSVPYVQYGNNTSNMTKKKNTSLRTKNTSVPIGKSDKKWLTGDDFILLLTNIKLVNLGRNG